MGGKIGLKERGKKRISLSGEKSGTKVYKEWNIAKIEALIPPLFVLFSHLLCSLFLEL